jgi:superfamily II DNA or RNA helicase
VEAITYRSDGSEVLHDVSRELAKTVGYFATGEPHRDLDPEGTRQTIKVRPYQLEGIQEVQTRRSEGDRATLLHVATGLGKTTMDAMDALQFELWRKKRGTTRHLFTAHRTELVDQAMQTYRRYFPDASCSLLTGERKDEVRPTTRFTFATLQTLENMRESFRPNWWHRITVDESHHAPADSYNATIRYFDPEFLLGVTGTPFRSDERELSDIFGETAYSMSLSQGIVEGWLVKIKYKLLVDSILKDVLDQDFSSVEALNRALFVPRRNQEIAKIVQKEQRRHANPHTLGFCRDTEHAEIMAALFPEAEAIHSGLPRRVRDQRTKAFRNGTLPTAMTIDMFTEGFDVPRTNILGFFRATGSRGVFDQQLGRGMRAAEGKEYLTVIDVVGNSERLFMLHHLAREIQQDYRTYHRRPDMTQKQLDELDRRAREFTGAMGLSFAEREIAIIERMQEIAEAPTRPKDWRSITGIATQHGVVYSKILKIVGDLRLEGAIMRNSQGNRSIYFSPLQQAYIGVAMEHNDRMAEWPTVAAAAEELSMSDSGVRSVLRRLKRPARALLIGSMIKIVPPEDVEAIRKDQELGNHSMSIAEIARRGNATEGRAKTVAKQLNVVGQLLKNGRTIYGAKDAAKAVIRLLKEDKGPLVPPPKGARSLQELKRLDEFKGIRNALNMLSIEPGKYANERGHPVRFLTRSEQDRVRKLLVPPPDDHLSYSEAATLYGISNSRVGILVKRHKLETTTYAQRSHKVPRPHLGPAALDELGRLAAEETKVGRPPKKK